jgi:hypothetical protein
MLRRNPTRIALGGPRDAPRCSRVFSYHGILRDDRSSGYHTTVAVMRRPWTEDDVARLREMRASGDSLRFMARVLNRHQGTVANKCKRLGLLRSDEVGRQMAPDRSAPLKKWKVVPPPPPAPLPPFEMLHLPLAELDGPQCHFPLGDRGSFTFCGLATGGGTYCSFHDSITHMRAA